MLLLVKEAMTQQEALTILKTGANVFLTGKPGSGKTYTVNTYTRYLQEAGIPTAVTASTGIAATHIGGITIHSWSGIGIKKSLSKFDVDRIASTERLSKRISKTAVLIIDEVSMLDGAVLQSVNAVCQAVRQSSEPFGGLQVVLVGDFFQLPPVAREGEAPARFAFTSRAWAALNPLVCYLTEQHRQADSEFLDILSALRENTVAQKHRRQLDERCVEPAGPVKNSMTRLYSHNSDVDRINEAQLKKIEGSIKAFRMKELGKKSLVEQLRRGCLSPDYLMLKEGAAVMFTKNDPKGKFVNGTLGTVSGWHKHTRLPIVTTKAGRRVEAEPMDWTIEDNGRVLARVTQVPLRLAWAITVHKSQGMSLDSAVVDLSQAFESGQGYVALSRVRTLQGLYLAGYNEQALQVHPEVLSQDADFHRLSSEAASAFGKLSVSELQEMHRNFIRASGGQVVSKGYSVQALREKYPNAYRPWQQNEDEILTESWRGKATTKSLAELLGRQPGAIRSRLRKLGLETSH
jgi:ATP-dependent DNA helicase PIF1